MSNVPQRYFLTPRACAGIIRRAQSRGKNLPPYLADALWSVVLNHLGKTYETLTEADLDQFEEKGKRLMMPNV